MDTENKVSLSLDTDNKQKKLNQEEYNPKKMKELLDGFKNELNYIKLNAFTKLNSLIKDITNNKQIRRMAGIQKNDAVVNLKTNKISEIPKEKNTKIQTTVNAKPVSKNDDLIDNKAKGTSTLSKITGSVKKLVENVKDKFTKKKEDSDKGRLITPEQRNKSSDLALKHDGVVKIIKDTDHIINIKKYDKAQQEDETSKAIKEIITTQASTPDKQKTSDEACLRI